VSFLELTGIAKCFGGTQALAGVDLQVGEDELLVVLGPTGAGKTTLLRTIAGLEAPDAGSVRMAGVDVTGASPADRDVALVFQNFSLYPDWTVRRNLEFPLRAPGRNLPEDEIRRRIDWAAGLLRIGELLERNAARLSGGQMQRVAIGRAIVRRPRLFLMDEPLTNLDAKLRESLRVELAVLRRELKTPMVYVTHDQAEALSMGDRIAVLDAGRILQTGTPEDVYRRPASLLVARQLGQPRINTCEVARRDGWWCAADGTRLQPAGPDGGDRAVLGVRPEDLRLGDGPLTGSVRVVEASGPHLVLVVAAAGVEWHALAEVASVQAGAAVRLAIGRAVIWPTA
jgi:multiple sugar transport system ATP-binding protein